MIRPAPPLPAWMFYLAIFTAYVTPFYMMRAWWMTFMHLEMMEADLRIVEINAEIPLLRSTVALDGGGDGHRAAEYGQERGDHPAHADEAFFCGPGKNALVVATYSA